MDMIKVNYVGNAEVFVPKLKTRPMGVKLPMGVETDTLLLTIDEVNDLNRILPGSFVPVEQKQEDTQVVAKGNKVKVQQKAEAEEGVNG